MVEGRIAERMKACWKDKGGSPPTESAVERALSKVKGSALTDSRGRRLIEVVLMAATERYALSNDPIVIFHLPFLSTKNGNKQLRWWH
uniref:Uncharacterized protein n=1 Tax=Steinernema glaseri TaxID=37863 RepID=A0A1I8A9V7_9BILA